MLWKQSEETVVSLERVRVTLVYCQNGKSHFVKRVYRIMCGTILVINESSISDIKQVSETQIKFLKETFSQWQENIQINQKHSDIWFIWSYVTLGVFLTIYQCFSSLTEGLLQVDVMFSGILCSVNVQGTMVRWAAQIQQFGRWVNCYNIFSEISLES